MRRGVHHALGQRDPWGERNFVIATGARIADQADGEKNCDHDVLLSEPASDGTRGLRALPKSVAQRELRKSVAQERCPRALPKTIPCRSFGIGPTRYTFVLPLT